MATVDEWHALQRAFYDGCRDEVALLLGEPGWRLTDDEPMVVTWFTPRGVDGRQPRPCGAVRSQSSGPAGDDVLRVELVVRRVVVRLDLVDRRRLGDARAAGRARA